MQSPKLRQFLSIAWLLVTLSLAAWWLVFGLRQIERLATLDHNLAADLVRQQRMLLGEGSFLLVIVLAGGAGLIYLSHREAKRREEMQHFLSGFTHELKTSLASLRLQSEILMEEEPASPRLQRLLREVVRLEIQLDNSLLLARAETAVLYPEKINISELTSRLTSLWPGLELKLESDATVAGDRRALESIFKNIIQNAYHHGEANLVKITGQTRDKKVFITVQDNGSGFTGQSERLGQAFFRHNGRSGSGLGLFLSKQLLKRMHGELVVPQQNSTGFTVCIVLEAAV